MVVFMLERLSDSVALIDTEALGERAVVAAYLVSGKENALIDMGYRSSAGIVIRDLEAHGITGLDYLMPTHVHLDHCGSCGTLAKRYPEASVLVHPRGQPHVHDPQRLVEGAKELFGERLMERYGLPDPVEANRLCSVADDEAFQLGAGVVLRSVWTSGHAPHHLSYLHEGDGTLFTGDAVGVCHPAFPALMPTTPPPSFNFEKAIETLDRLNTSSVKRFCTPHFGALDTVHEFIQQNLAALRDWNARLAEYSSKGVKVEQIVEMVLKDACKQIGRPIMDVPEYLRIMTRASVLGFKGYHEWKGAQATSQKNI